MRIKLHNGFEYSDNARRNCTIHNPKNEKTYSCITKNKKDKILKVIGYLKIYLIGKTVEWAKLKWHILKV